jgi:hypothetical protein
VSKHKDSKVLFEALSNKSSSGPMKVPGWMKDQTVEEDPAVAGEAEGVVADLPEETPRGLDELDAVVTPPAPTPPPTKPRRADGYFSRVDEIPTPTVSVSLTQLIALLVTVLLLLILSFWLGYRTGSPDGPTSETPVSKTQSNGGSGSSKTQTKTQTKTNGGGGSSVISRHIDPKAPVLAATPGERVSNRYYLVIQLLGSEAGDKTEAERIKTFLASKGVSASVSRGAQSSGQQYYMVWDLLGYSSRHDDSAKQRIAEIEALGKEYFRQHTTHLFKGPFYINGPSGR